MKGTKFDCNEGWDETKGFLGAKNTPKVPVCCSCPSNGSRTLESHHRNVCFFCIEMTLKYIKLQFFLASNGGGFVSEKQKQTGI